MDRQQNLHQVGLGQAHGLLVGRLAFGLHGAGRGALAALVILVGPMLAEAQYFAYTTNNGTITITGYRGPGGVVSIPGRINGLDVTDIGNSAFFNNLFKHYPRYSNRKVWWKLLFRNYELAL